MTDHGEHREITLFDDITPAPNQSHLRPTAVLMRLTEGEASGYYPITKDQIVIGRGPDCDLVIKEKRLSRRHATLEHRTTSGDRPEVTITDAGSTNGTYVNGERITVPRILQNGDRIQFVGLEYGFFIRTHIEVEKEAEYRKSLALKGLQSESTRIPVEMEITLAILFPEDTFSPTMIPAMMRDISRQGARITTSALPPDIYEKMLQSKRYVRLESSIPQAERKMQLKGQLAWIHLDEKTSPPTCSLGVCFDPQDKLSAPVVSYLGARFAPKAAQDDVDDQA